MGVPQFRRIQTADTVLGRLQDAIAAAFRPLETMDLVGSQVVSGVVLVAGSTNRVSHGLGKRLTGWVPVRVRGQCKLWDSQDTNTTPDKTLELHTDTNVTVDVLVF